MAAKGKIALLVVLVVSLISAVFISSLGDTAPAPSADADQRPQLPPGVMFWPDEAKPYEDIFASAIDEPEQSALPALPAPEESDPTDLQRDTAPTLIAKDTSPTEWQLLVSLASTIPGTSSEDITAPDMGLYIVKSGDNLWDIALELLGDGTRYQEIVKLNADKIKRANDISIGMKLKIPPR